MAATELTTDCCGETTPTNPKTDLFGRRQRPKGLEITALKNPIPQEVEDTGEVQKVFKDLKLVPYAGTTAHSGHSLLVWYLMLAQLSPTHAACIRKKLTYAVGGKATVIKALDNEWNTGEETQPVPTATQNQYRDSVKELVEFDGGIRKFHHRTGWSYEATGNAWVEMVYSETLGVGRVNLKTHTVTHCLYLNTKPGEMKIVAVSPVWTKAYLDKNEPRYVPLYPNFEKDKDGNMRTMFHLKNGTGWYGRPDSAGADLYKYREVQDSIYLVKQAGANFTGQLIIEVEDDDPQFAPAFDEDGAKEAGFKNFSHQFQENYTAKSEQPQSVLLTARPFGSTPMFVFQVAPNTNENWYLVTGKIAEEKIMHSHGCTQRFMGFDTANGFSTDAFVSDYVMNMEPVINELRDEILQFSNSALSAAWLELLNKPDLNEYSVSFTPPIASAIENYKTASAAPVTQPATQP